jgi:hypothetical protein
LRRGWAALDERLVRGWAQATGSKLDGLMFLGLEGARVSVVGAGVFM